MASHGEEDRSGENDGADHADCDNGLDGPTRKPTKGRFHPHVDGGHPLRGGEKAEWTKQRGKNFGQRHFEKSRSAFSRPKLKSRRAKRRPSRSAAALTKSNKAARTQAHQRRLGAQAESMMRFQLFKGMLNGNLKKSENSGFGSVLSRERVCFFAQQKISGDVSERPNTAGTFHVGTRYVST